MPRMLFVTGAEPHSWCLPPENSRLSDVSCHAAMEALFHVLIKDAMGYAGLGEPPSLDGGFSMYSQHRQLVQTGSTIPLFQP